MRYMTIVKATKDSEAGQMPPEHLFAEMAGYVKSRAEALEWTKKFPNPTHEGTDCDIEVRRMLELEDFGNGATMDRFREIGLTAAEKPA